MKTNQVTMVFWMMMCIIIASCMVSYGERYDLFPGKTYEFTSITMEACNLTCLNPPIGNYDAIFLNQAGTVSREAPNCGFGDIELPAGEKMVITPSVNLKSPVSFKTILNTVKVKPYTGTALFIHSSLMPGKTYELTVKGTDLNASLYCYNPYGGNYDAILYNEVGGITREDPNSQYADIGLSVGEKLVLTINKNSKESFLLAVRTNTVNIKEVADINLFSRFVLMPGNSYELTTKGADTSVLLHCDNPMSGNYDAILYNEVGGVTREDPNSQYADIDLPVVGKLVMTINKASKESLHLTIRKDTVKIMIVSGVQLFSRLTLLPGKTYEITNLDTETEMSLYCENPMCGYYDAVLYNEAGDNDQKLQNEQYNNLVLSAKWKILIKLLMKSKESLKLIYRASTISVKLPDGNVIKPIISNPQYVTPGEIQPEPSITQPITPNPTETPKDSPLKTENIPDNLTVKRGEPFKLTGLIKSTQPITKVTVNVLETGQELYTSVPEKVMLDLGTVNITNTDTDAFPNIGKYTMHIWAKTATYDPGDTPLATISMQVFPKSEIVNTSSKGLSTECYLPLKEGNTWIYQDTAIEDHTVTKSTVVVGALTTYNKQKAYCMDMQMTNANGNATATQYVNHTTDGLVYYGTKIGTFDIQRKTPDIALSAILDKGTTWIWKENNEKNTYRIIGEEKVTVPAGTFTALKVRSIDKDDTAYVWYVKEVGIVKTEDNERISELKSYKLVVNDAINEPTTLDKNDTEVLTSVSATYLAKDKTTGNDSVYLTAVVNVEIMKREVAKGLGTKPQVYVKIFKNLDYPLKPCYQESLYRVFDKFPESTPDQNNYEVYIPADKLPRGEELRIIYYIKSYSPEGIADKNKSQTMKIPQVVSANWTIKYDENTDDIVAFVDVRDIQNLPTFYLAINQDPTNGTYSYGKCNEKSIIAEPFTGDGDQAKFAKIGKGYTDGRLFMHWNRTDLKMEPGTYQCAVIQKEYEKWSSPKYIHIPYIDVPVSKPSVTEWAKFTKYDQISHNITFKALTTTIPDDYQVVLITGAKKYKFQRDEKNKNTYTMINTDISTFGWHEGDSPDYLIEIDDENGKFIDSTKSTNITLTAPSQAPQGEIPTAGNENSANTQALLGKRKRAIIVLPGIMGSKLYELKSHKRFWPPWPLIPEEKVGYIVRDVAGYSVEEPIEVNQADVDAGVRQFGTQAYFEKRQLLDIRNIPKIGANLYLGTTIEGVYNNIAKKIFTAFGKEGNCSVVFFSYNWLASNQTAADELYSYIKAKGYTDVLLVCHSMGGIVASDYIKSYYNDSKVREIITLGTPYYGSPVMFSVFDRCDIVDSGVPKNILQIIMNCKGLINGKYLSSVVANAESFYELTCPNNLKMIAINNSKGISPPTSWDQLLVNYGKVTSRQLGNTSLGDTAHIDKLKAGFNHLPNQYIEGKHVFQHYGIEYYAFITRDINTPQAAYFGNYEKNKNLLAMYIDDNSKYNNGFIWKLDGDGTVPYWSASMNNTIDGGRIVHITGISHGDLATDDGVINQVIDKIRACKDMW